MSHEETPSEWPVPGTEALRPGRAASGRWPGWLAYGLAVAVTVTALFVHHLVLAFTTDNQPAPIVLLLPIILSAYLGGLGPGLISTVLAALGMSYFLLPPAYTFYSARPIDYVRLATLIVAGMLISVLNEALHRSRQRAEATLTERQQAEETLRRVNAELAASLERLHLAQDAANAGIWEWDLRTNENVWSEALWQLYGLEPHSCEPSYEAWRQTIHPEDRPKAEQVVQAAARQGIELNAEWRARYRDGTERWLMSRGRPVRDADGQLVRYLGIVLDITERKRAEEALRESEARLQLAQQVAHIGTFEWNIQTGVNRWTPELEAMYGLPPGGFPGTQAAWEQLVYADDRPEAVRRVQEALEQGGFEGEWRVHWPDGTVRWLAGRAWVFKDEAGQPLRLLGINIDITERKQAEAALTKRTEELARSNKDLEQFAHVASHDLQEPLRAVAGCVQLLQKRYQGQLDERADEFIAHAVEGAERMRQLIDDLLAFSRVGIRGGPLQPVDSGAALAAALANLTVAIHESGAVVTHDPLPTVTADPTQLTLLLQNLISNAIKFRREGSPRIHVGAQRQGHHWVLSVRDNGIGIEPQYFERIFGIFQRLHTRREYAGTGIGLAICKKIVERHGGRIWVESVPGAGCTFYCSLPDGQ